MPPKHRGSEGSSRGTPAPRWKKMPVIGASEKKKTPNPRRLAVSTINDVDGSSGPSGLSAPAQEKAKKKTTWVPPRRKKGFRVSKALNTRADQDEDDHPVQDYSVPLPIATATRCDDATMKENVEEANLLTLQLNELGSGEDISYEEFRGYLHLLPRDPRVDRCTELDCNLLDAQNELHALYHVKYYKLLQQVPGTGSKLYHDEMINQYPFDVSKELEGVLMCFENDGTLDSVDDEVFWEALKCLDYTFDWYFHPEYCMLDALVDYQRLVIKNDGFMYANWNSYHTYLNTYDVEKQYVNYYSELSKKLKWMEDYVLLEQPSLEWGRVSNRGIYQAVKIATGFPKITAKLAYLGFDELESSMTYDVCFFKELDGVYFEIWQRVTKQKMSFRDALKEVYELNRFPVRQHKMKYALEINDCSQWEAEFHTCTACITEKVAEDEVLGLIAEAVKKLRNKPHFYDDYIRKKIDIARAIGLITTAES